MDTPRLIVICGYPGVGKSTVASLIAEETNARIYDSDHVRKELFPDPTYSREESRTVYNELLERGREALEDGETVVLDATFSRRSKREQAESIADDLGV
ncbi:MAG: AAA family ATPase, partial [Halobacteria archaeon]|nr:AAA family ATPase [Halobacteria archaeon]